MYEITVKNAKTPDLPPPLDPNKAAAATANDDDGDEATPSPPAPDLVLREAEHILADDVQLLDAAASPVPSPH